MLYPKPATDEFILGEGQTLSDDEEVLFKEKLVMRDELLEAVYIQACYCSLGAAVISECRKDFDEFMKKTSGLMLVDGSVEKPATTRQIPTQYPTLYEYLLDVDKQIWVPWRVKILKYAHERGKSFGEILVPTMDTVRANWYVQLMNKINKPLVLVGDTGTSKTAIILDFLRHLDSEKFVSIPKY